jgi:hypothetical protein
MSKRILFAALAITVLAGCVSNPEKNKGGLADGQWFANAAAVTPKGKTAIETSPVDPRLKNRVTVVDETRSPDGKHCLEIQAAQVDDDRNTYNRSGTVCAKPAEAYSYQKKPNPSAAETAKAAEKAAKKEAKAEKKAAKKKKKADAAATAANTPAASAPTAANPAPAAPAAAKADEKK